MPKIRYPKTGTWVVRTRHMHCVPAPLTLRGFGSGFRLSRARRPRRRIYYLARSESCASVRELRIPILSGCVGGFFVPKNRSTSIHKCAFCYFSHPGLARFAKA